VLNLTGKAFTFKLENMAMDQVQIVMAKRKPNWSESALLAISDPVASNIFTSKVSIAHDFQK
jgi:hypothetical protein